MEVAGVMITYYPDAKDTLENIRRFIDDLDLLIIWENTPEEDRLANRLDLQGFGNKVKILGSGKNEGISHALNESFKYAISKGFKFILTMDQDSIWKDFSGYIQNVYRNLGQKTSIYAPVIVNSFTNEKLRCNNDEFVITSGSVFDLDLFQEIGEFNEKYFIDEVDNEYCVKSRAKGYNIELLRDNYLYQTFGSPDSNQGLKKYTSNYSAFRTYYQTRNRIWMWREYSKFLSYRYILRTVLYGVFRRSALIVLFEDNKVSKLKSINRGIIDGLFTKFN